MSNNIGLPTASAGTFQFNLNYDWNNLDRLKAGDRSLNDDTRQRETHTFLVESGYSFSDEFSIDLFIPFIQQERTITTLSTPDREVTRGIGDIVILPKYTIHKKFTIGIGVKLPTGNADIADDRGIVLLADLQPGSGALDGILFLAYQDYSKTRPSFGYFGNAILRYTGVNESYFGDRSYEFGNELQVALGVSDRFVLLGRILDPSLRIQYRKRGKDFFEGQEFPGSGGDFLLINPGVSLPLSTKLSWQANATVPFYSHVKDTQLSPTFQLNVGFTFKTNLKSKETIQI